MPVYKDKGRNTYYVKMYYTDWTGERKQKLKRGFKLQREAKEWERAFLERQAGSPDMSFYALYELYLEDIRARLKESSVNTKKLCIEYRVLPYFKDKPINQITPSDVRNWQNTLIKDGLKQTTLRNINNQLNAMLNFAVKYYGLSQNPCKVTGLIGKSRADRMEFWTHEEFRTFIAHTNNPMYTALFSVLYYTGLRCGEALALSPTDVDFDNHLLHVTKTYLRLRGEDLITPPKTPKSVRDVPIPDFLCDMLRDYIEQHNFKNNDRIFPFVNCVLDKPIRRICKRSGVKLIRIHDIRHSHVSLLIDLGFPPMLIAERIGDTVGMVNNIYGHLYPNRHKEVADKLNQLVSL